MIKSQEAPLFVVGNGPSLRGFDFSLLEGRQWLGMNAAYRYWDTVGIYPTYYSCLDLVVGLSHKQEIQRLVRNAESLGIRSFLLRDNLIRELPSALRQSSRIQNFDRLQCTTEVLADPGITTGSHSALYGAFEGFRVLVLLGIDVNYVEVVDGAVNGPGFVLEIVREGENPNYFFDSYQRLGDRYNQPNPLPSLHAQAWHRALATLHSVGVTVVAGTTATPFSLVPRLPFDDACEVAEGIAANPLPRDAKAVRMLTSQIEFVPDSTVEATPDIIFALSDPQFDPPRQLIGSVIVDPSVQRSLEIGSNFDRVVEINPAICMKSDSASPGCVRLAGVLTDYGDAQVEMFQSADGTTSFLSAEETASTRLVSNYSWADIIERSPDPDGIPDALILNCPGLELAAIRSVAPERSPRFVSVRLERSALLRGQATPREVGRALHGLGLTVCFSVWRQSDGHLQRWGGLYVTSDLSQGLSDDSWERVEVLAFEFTPNLEALSASIEGWKAKQSNPRGKAHRPDAENTADAVEVEKPPPSRSPRWIPLRTAKPRVKRLVRASWQRAGGRRVAILLLTVASISSLLLVQMSADVLAGGLAAFAVSFSSLLAILTVGFLDRRRRRADTDLLEALLERDNASKSRWDVHEQRLRQFEEALSNVQDHVAPNDS